MGTKKRKLSDAQYQKMYGKPKNSTRTGSSKKSQSSSSSGRNKGEMTGSSYSSRTYSTPSKSASEQANERGRTRTARTNVQQQQSYTPTRTNTVHGRNDSDINRYNRITGSSSTAQNSMNRNVGMNRAQGSSSNTDRTSAGTAARAKEAWNRLEEDRKAREAESRARRNQKMTGGVTKADQQKSRQRFATAREQLNERAKEAQKTKMGAQVSEEEQTAADRAFRNTPGLAKKAILDTVQGHGKTIADLTELTASNKNGTDALAMKMGIQDDPRKRRELEKQRQETVKKAREDRERWQKEQDKRQAAWDKKTKDAKGLEKAYYGAVESGVGMLTDTVLGLGNPGASLAAMGSRTYGSTRGQAQKEGATERKDRLYSLLQAGKEVGTELMFPGVGLARRAYGRAGLPLAEKAANALTRSLRGRTADITRAGLRLLGGIVEENAEEIAGWGLDPLIKEFTYGRNVRRRDAKETMNRVSDSIRSNIQSEEDAVAASAYLSSASFLEETKREYMAEGMSEADAEEVALKMRDFLTASLVGDTDTMERLEDEVSKKVAGTKLDWDWKELGETIASTTLLTGVTGLPGAITTAARGAAIRDELGADGVRALANTAIDFEDEKDSYKGQAARDRIDSGKELTSTQVYDLAEAMQKQAETDNKRNVASKTQAIDAIENEKLVIPYGVNQNGNLEMDDVVADKFESDAREASNTIRSYESTSEGSESLTDTEVRNGSKAIAGFKSGIFTIEDANELNYRNTAVRSAFESETGVNLEQYVVKNKDGTVNVPATNAATKDALFAMAADNLVESARVATVNWMDNVKGEVVTQVTARMGAQGSVALQAALDDVDERNRSGYMMVANASDMLYQSARNMGTEWDNVKDQATKMFPQIAESKLESMYNAGLEDRRNANDILRNRSIRIGNALTEVGEQERSPEAGRVYVDTETSPKGTVVRAFSELASNLGVDIHLVDNIETSTGKQANGYYINGAIYINVNSDFEQNMGYIFMHEVTHHLKMIAPEEYAALENLVREKWFEYDDAQMQNEIARKIQSYADAGQTLTEEEALEEIIADAAHEFLNDPNFANQVAEDNPTLAKAILNSVRNALRMLRRVLATGSIDDETHMNNLFSQLDIFDEAEKLWLNAYTAAYQNKAALAIDNWQDEVNERYSASEPTKKSNSAAAKYERGEKLTHKQFNSYYSAHKLNLRGQDNIEEQIDDIKANGFVSTTALSNVVPAGINDFVDSERPNYTEGRYGAREGDVVLLVPKDYLDQKNDRVKSGFVPRDYEVVTVERDFQPYYELYEKAYDEANTGERFSISEQQDSDYMAAVESGDMETAQRMVDEAAAQAMPNTKTPGRWFHGTENEFTEFDFSQGGKNGTAEGFGIYLAKDRDVSEHYGKRMIEGYVNIEHPASSSERTLTKDDLVKLISATVDQEAERLSEDYDSVDAAKLDTWISNYTYTYDKSLEDSISEVADNILRMNENDMEIVQEVMGGMAIRRYEDASAFYDILTDLTGIDGFTTTWENQALEGTRDIALAFRSEQIKDSSPVTYDDEGNVIPLSQRFNMENPDIRYSISDTMSVLEENFNEYKEDKTNLRIATEALDDLQRVRYALSKSSERDVSGRWDGGVQVRTIAKGISTELVREGYVEFRGQKVETPEDLAKLCQVLRDPRYETFRLVLTKGDKIVSFRSISSRLPGLSSAFELDDVRESIDLVRDRMNRLGADGYYLIHNHPSGDVNASFEDLSATRAYLALLGQDTYKGHIILDHDEFGFIDADIPQEINGSNYPTPRVEPIEGQQTLDFIHEPEIDHAVLGSKIKDSKDVARVAQTINSTDGISVLLYTSTKAEVRGVQEISNKALKNNKEISGYIRNQAVDEFGSSGVFLYTTDLDTYNASKELIKSGHLVDSVIGYGPDTKRLESGRQNVAELGKIGMLGLTEEEDAKRKSVFESATGAARYSLSTTDSDGKVLTDGQMEYFKNSQARDEQGRLLRLYHGTQNGGFTIFDPSYGISSRAFFFTNSLASAKGYSGTDAEFTPDMAGEEDIRVNYPVYLDMQNPLIVDAEGHAWVDIPFDGDYVSSNWLVEYAQSEGYDSVIIKNVIDRGSADTELTPQDDYIVFNSNQVKDVNNLNPTENPDIRYSITPEDEVKSTMAYEDAVDESYEQIARYEAMLDGTSEDFEYTRPIPERRVSAFYAGLTNVDSRVYSDVKLEEDAVRMARSKNDFYNHLNAKWQDRRTTEGEVLDIKSVKTNVRNLVMGVMQNSASDSKYKNDIVKKTLLDMKTAYQLMKQDRTDVAFALLYYSAQRMIDNVEFYTDGTFDQYKKLRDYLRTTKISLGEEYWSDVDYDAFRKANFGRLKLVKGTTNVDQVYQELESMFPEWFNEEENMTIPDQLLQIDHVLDAIQPYKEAYSSEEAASLAFDIADDLYEIMVNGEELTSLADRYKQSYEAKVDAMKQRHAEAMLRMRKARDIGVLRERAKWRAREMAKKEKANHRKHYERIQKNYDWLVQRVLDPTKDKNVPEEFRQSLAEMLQTLDMQTEASKKLEAKTGHVANKTFKMREFKDRLNEMATKKGENGISIFEFDENVGFLMDALVKKLDGQSVDALDTRTITEVDKVLAAIRGAMARQNKIRIDNKSQEISEIAGGITEDFLSHVERFGRAKKYEGIRGGMNAINTASLTPVYFFERLGKFNQMYEELRYGGFDTYVRNEKFIIERLKEITKPYYKEGRIRKSRPKPGSELEKWRDSRSAQTFNLTHGPITLSAAQMMSLYCLSKRPQAMQHMLSMNGGIVATPIDAGSKIEKAKERLLGKTETNQKVVVTEADIQAIIAKLTPEQMSVADQLQELMSVDMARLGNEAHREMYGYDVFEDPNYFPIKVHGNEVATDINDLGDVIQKIKSFGPAKPLDPNANNLIEIDDIFSVTADHCNGMNLYNAFLVPISDFMRVYNYKQYFDDGKDAITVKDALEAAHGKRAMDYILNFMKDINGIKPDNRGGLEDVINKALGTAKKTAVFGNIRVALQQPTAIARALAELDAKYLTPLLNVRPEKGVMEEMWNYCPIAYWKSLGFYDAYMGRDIEDVMMNNWSVADAALSGVYGELDNWTWSLIWRGVKAEQAAAHPEMDTKSEEFLQLCGRRASEVFDKTQVVDSTFHRSDAMRSRQIAIKSLTAFMAEPTLTLNVFRAGWHNAIDAWMNGEKGKATKIFNRALSVIIAQAALVSVAQAVADAWRGKDPDLPWDDDDDDEKNKDRTYMDRLVRNMVANFFDNLHLENNIYLVKDGMPLFNYIMSRAGDYNGWNETFRFIMGWDQEFLYSNSNLIYAGGENIAKGIAEIYKKLEKGDEYIDYNTGEPKSWYDIIQKTASGVGTFTGLPFGTLMRDFKPLLEKAFAVTFAADGSDMDTVITKKIDEWTGAGNGKGSDGGKSDGKGSKSSKSSDGSDRTSPDLNVTMDGFMTDEELEQDSKDKLAAVKDKVDGLPSTEKNQAIFDKTNDLFGGYINLIEKGRFDEIERMRSIIEAAGGNVKDFDAKVLAKSKTAYKKTLGDSMKLEQQWATQDYLKKHGVSDEEISELCYKSYTKSDLVYCWNNGYTEAAEHEMFVLASAGMSVADMEKAYKYRNRQRSYNGKYTDEEYVARWTTLQERQTQSTGKFTWPTDGIITSDFGGRSSPGGIGSTNHQGIDIGASTGTPACAVDGGEIVMAGWFGGYGNTVQIKHNDGTVTQYSHLNSINCNVGDRVAQGAQVGEVGSTGNSTGPHLHFGVMVDGNYVDPLDYLDASGKEWNLDA